MPPATPWTMPPEVTVAMAVLELPHTPPEVESDSVAVVPPHRVDGIVPVMAAGVPGSGLTVTAATAVLAPHEEETV